MWPKFLEEGGIENENVTKDSWRRGIGVGLILGKNFLPGERQRIGELEMASG